VLSFPFLPKELAGGGKIRERSIRDHVPYDTWANEGHLELTEGNVVDYGHVRRRINELGDVYNIRQIGHDPWNAAEITQHLTEDGFEMVPVRQGFATMSDPCKELERRVLGRLIAHDGHPVLRWSMSVCSIKQDPAGNIKPVKPDRLKTGKRIDPVIAMVNGLFCLIRHETEGVIDADELMFA
jgi:phage terminase large subunit-like protein